MKIVYDAKAMLAETPCYIKQTNSIMWTNLNDGEVNILDLASKTNRCIQVHKRIGSAIPSEDGTFAVCALEDGLYELDLENETLQLIASIEPERKDFRMNDARCDSAGRVFCSTTAVCYGFPEYTSDMVGSFYRVDTDGTVTTIVKDIQLYNGIAFNDKNTKLYVVDSYKSVIYSFDYDLSTGDASNQQVLCSISEEYGVPDGLAIDERNRLYVGHWGGYLTVWDAVTGGLVEAIQTGFTNNSCVGFDGNGIGYLTTARLHLSEQQLEEEPLAGGIFEFRIDAKGYPHHFCKRMKKAEIS